MRRSTTVAGVLLVALIATGCAKGPRTGLEAPLDATVAREEFAAKVTASIEVLTRLVPADRPGCSAAVAVEGSVLWAGASGLADLGARTPVTTSTRFDIASITKQFTATAILMLQREGKLSVNDTIGMYVEGLPDWGATITLDQLIHHTSRIRDFWVELDDVGIGFSDPATQADTVAAISREDELEPGTGFYYSNANYVLLAEVVQRVSGQALPDFLADRIFTPLGLDMVVAPALRAPDLALSYDDDLNYQQPEWLAYGHVGIITTPSDLARWGDQYRVGGIVEDDFAANAVPEDDAGELYAAGIDIEADGDLNHTGRWGGYIAEFTVSEDRLTTIAVACNGHTSDRWGVTDALWAIWDPNTTDPGPR